MANVSRGSDDYSSDEDVQRKKHKMSRRQSKAHGNKGKPLIQNQLKRQLIKVIKSGDETENEREDSLITNSSKDTAEKLKKK